LANREELRSAMGQSSYERIQSYSPEKCADGIAAAAQSAYSDQGAAG
jgi:hypothetical protein